MDDKDLDALAHQPLEDDTDRKHGQAILDMLEARGRQGDDPDPLIEMLNRAHQEEADKE